MSGIWIDTHNHFFVCGTDAQLSEQIRAAKEAGVRQMLICAGGAENFEATVSVAERFGSGYALGLHPLFITERWQEDLAALEEKLIERIDDPYLCAVGECGLDGSEDSKAPMSVQEAVFAAQLKLARRFDLPVSVHARGAIDTVTKWLRRIPVKGCVHAFNGSAAQAQALLKLGLKLGYGGAMTYEGSKRIRKIFSELPEDAWVLETDAPDMPGSAARMLNPENPVSRVADIAEYAAVASSLRNTEKEEIGRQAFLNTETAFPRLTRLPAIGEKQS